MAQQSMFVFQAEFFGPSEFEEVKAWLLHLAHHAWGANARYRIFYDPDPDRVYGRIKTLIIAHDDIYDSCQEWKSFTHDPPQYVPELGIFFAEQGILPLQVTMPFSADTMAQRACRRMEAVECLREAITT